MSVDKMSGITHNFIKADEIKKADYGTSKEAQTLRERDKVEISPEAKELQETLRDLRTEIRKIPDVRKEKIRDVKARIENGSYDQDAVIKEVAKSLRESGVL